MFYVHVWNTCVVDNWETSGKEVFRLLNCFKWRLTFQSRLFHSYRCEYFRVVEKTCVSWKKPNIHKQTIWKGLRSRIENAGKSHETCMQMFHLTNMYLAVFRVTMDTQKNQRTEITYWITQNLLRNGSNVVIALSWHKQWHLSHNWWFQYTETSK